MPIISVEIMKKIGEKETQKTKQNKTKFKKKKKKTERENKGDANYSERYKWFCWAFKFSPINM